MAKSSSRSVWVLPNSRTVGLVAILLAMWYAGASQSNGAAYLLGFVLATVAAVSWVHAWSNLRGFAVRALTVPPVFAGDEVIIPTAFTTQRRRPHFGLRAVAKGSKIVEVVPEVGGSDDTDGQIRFVGLRRGHFLEIPIVISSSYPLGFFTASRRFVLPVSYYVYPRPIGSAPLPRSVSPTREPVSGARIEGEDFGGVRTWRPGESQRHIDWKAAARGQPLMTKEWTGDANLVLRLDWNVVPAESVEMRLSQLAQWVVTAERSGEMYSLHLPGEAIPASRGDVHFHRCLRSLAAYRDSGNGGEA